MSEMRIFDPEGNRLYVNQEEVVRFLAAARESNSNIRTFAETLVYTGCRISEALNLSPGNINRKELSITFNSLKKRRGDIYRSVPVPQSYMDTLIVANQIVPRQKVKSKADKRLWTWTRQHAYEIIKKLMVVAGISPGSHRSPKGLRHAYGVNAISNDIPLNMLQKWMGHADIATTAAIYTNAIGKEEALIADKMWNFV
ncbi:MAG TPA: site-specific integrase [Pricia sp.]|nr:site-specific integrase [Pricia sp.]